MSLTLATTELSQESQKAMAGLQKSLPENEWRAVEAWISTFFPYQREWLLDWTRFSLLNKARQIGASHTYAGAAVLWGLLGETTTIISVGQTEAEEVLEKARAHAEVLRRLGSRWLTLKRNAQKVLSFASAGRVLALPSTSGGRSFSGNVLLDEFAYHADPETVWDGAGGTITHGFKLRVMSTPNGMGNLWANIYLDPDKHKGYRLHQTTLDEAIAQGLEVNIDDCWKQARNDPRVFDQLFNCKFLGGELQYLPTEAVRDCSVTNLYTYEGEYYAGLDIGRTVDKTVLIVVRKSPSGLRTVARIVSCKRTDSDLLEKIVYDAFREFRLKRICIDASGLGAFPAERIQKRHGRTRVEPMTFTQSTKEDLATGLYSAFTEQTVRIPLTDESLPGLQRGTAVALREDLCAIRREITSSGAVRYDAPHTEKGHADSAWALALALHASGGPQRRRHEVGISREIIY